MSAGTKAEVTMLTNQLREDGYRIVGEPRTTGDGYFESVVLDPDGNRIEITY
ncbi:Glyoxalase/Bleomycin resistance protein/Dioxygenase superfamily protein [Carnobacterium iners]|nr:Glyoxalase/Bleomycin resistance protein/Dioxygenase superfamily protein [Carnobacterium iners]